MSESARDLLVRGVAAAKAGDVEEARFYLKWVLRIDATSEQQAKAWLWLSEISDDPRAKRRCLEEALALDPGNYVVRRALAVVDGRLKPDEIIDPDKSPTATTKESGSQETPLQTRRFVCPQCGGKMAFGAGSRAVVCQYCGHEMTLLKAMQSGAVVQEHDFVVGMATAKGHTRPVGVQPFVCQGCGATFIVDRKTLSVTCAYCGSAHVVRQETIRQLIPPEAIIPFTVTYDEARRALRRWFIARKMRRVRIAPLRGLYLPAWTFDLSGEIRWICYVERKEPLSMTGSSFSVSIIGRVKVRVREEGVHLVYEDDILVPASHTLPPELFAAEVAHFVLTEAVPYEEGFLADWPAEVYAIPMADASLVARRIALERARQQLRPRLAAKYEGSPEAQLDTSGLIVESFKLILLPLWITRYRYQEGTYTIIVNGQTGNVRAQEPRGGWLRKLLAPLTG